MGLSWAPWKTWPVDPDWSLSLRRTAGVALWHASDAESNRSLVDFRAYPVLRLDLAPSQDSFRTSKAAWAERADAHVDRGAVNSARRSSSANSSGLGVAFGDKREFDIGVRYQHISNADIKQPNDGLTFGSMVFQYRFDP